MQQQINRQFSAFFYKTHKSNFLHYFTASFATANNIWYYLNQGGMLMVVSVFGHVGSKIRAGNVDRDISQLKLLGGQWDYAFFPNNWQMLLLLLNFSFRNLKRAFEADKFQKSSLYIAKILKTDISKPTHFDIYRNFCQK